MSNCNQKFEGHNYKVVLFINFIYNLYSVTKRVYFIFLYQKNVDIANTFI